MGLFDFLKSNSNMQEIDVQTLKAKRDADEDFVLIDVREPQEYQEYNIGGELIPLGSLNSRIATMTDLKDKEIVVHCRSGKRSAMAQEMLQKAGFSNVHNLRGGVLAWHEQYG